MKSSKKFLAMLLAVAMVFALCACGESAPAPAESAAPVEESAAPAEARPNRLIYGSTTEVSGDIGPGAWWTNNATDKMIRDLINDYSTVTTNQGGEYIVNDAVCGGI